ncbi:tRNA (adenosine(37)-N6)-threonylcarbamoyltransferase complex dimerization subunit type 1 TsaB [Periweissella beninensis]|uniref:tRNA (Adenosine(37)-N6)-threonylcarbamoyltransferase complex dimerization subunit type 1 TsaB n=1 Tax=Periweissella beninensis TaxID=504936 RepID=A0ABT0VJ76_9LACO|nr:tRNA (adenosine(37)-N6)-threonylcarbamoyltransferase complex dimerization subunit type 1 TsaB [Periweissella beninensis]MBM7544643.1 tRNA threonylcarbamoyl adenosine modification protein YeaZ [Periweissella beninensis]MCM2436914.1 tRNA (adenosine(37)-N6)-threonylcarbamoyltransferase complex dimerization subunit type 1 TsaB [Periweissella beninensis]MCT4396591.1 tRNA (adenosine(37)-N6)-threonylcarbamoyltransferase complex dimerization subunit type 1 TsaB [Periweissella beninensis]
MKILAMDTSNQPMALALVEDNRVLSEKLTNEKRNHSVQLLPMIAEMMQEVNWTPTMLNRVVVAQGPGSYTGVRIGVTTAKTLATTLNIELVGVSSLAVLANNIDQVDTLVVPIFDARNDNMYAGIYKNNAVIWPDQHTNITKLIANLTEFNSKIIVVGEYQNFVEQLTASFAERITFAKGLANLPKGSSVAQLGTAKAPEKWPHRFVPNYLRVSQAEADWQAKHPNEIEKDYVEEV